MIDAIPTTRAMVDVGRKCNVNCKHCYYRHLGDLRKQGFEAKENLMALIDSAYNRGCDYIDFSGGEPTIYPDMAEIVKYVNSKDMKCCIITNALIGENALQKLIDAGVDDWLLSVHAGEIKHDELVGMDGARKKQERFIKQLKDNDQSFRLNCVLSKWSQDSWDDVIDYMIEINPRIVNFINMNPHGNWQNDKEKTLSVIADLNRMESQLNKAIYRLETEGIGVNVRYYPMCRVSEEYRRTICNDLHVTFDPYEWDYEINPKNFANHRKWGVDTSINIEHKGIGCQECDLLHICGGINKAFIGAVGNTSIITPVKNFGGDKFDFYHYRKNNDMTLKKRGA